MIITLGISVGCNKNSAENSCVDQYRSTVENKTDEVNNRIQHLLDSEEYNNADIIGKKEKANELLTKLLKQGLIKSFFYDEKNCLFSFYYFDGTLGGIQLSDFRQKPNELPMN